jgi:hypothetical protein
VGPEAERAVWDEANHPSPAPVRNLALQHEDAQLLGQVSQYEASTLTGTPPATIEVMVKNLDYDTERENVKQRYERGERLEFNEPMLELCELYQVKAGAKR